MDVGEVLKPVRRHFTPLDHKLTQKHAIKEATVKSLDLKSKLEKDLANVRRPEEVFSLLANHVSSALPNSSGAIYTVSLAEPKDKAYVAERWGKSNSPNSLTDKELEKMRETLGTTVKDSRALTRRLYLVTELKNKLDGNVGLMIDDMVSLASGRLTTLEIGDNSSTELIEKAFKDSLTGLWNRGYFELQLQKASKARDQYAVAIVDADHLKAINDLLGHSVGDKLIVAIAELLKSIFRESDTVARLGGDEFAVLLDKLDPTKSFEEQTKNITERLLEKAKNTLVNNVPVQFSIGWAIGDGRGKQNSEEVLEKADKEMYAMKNRNGVKRGSI